jgi:hypothetical protein
MPFNLNRSTVLWRAELDISLITGHALALGAAIEAARASRNRTLNRYQRAGRRDAKQGASIPVAMLGSAILNDGIALERPATLRSRAKGSRAFELIKEGRSEV